MASNQALNCVSTIALAEQQSFVQGEPFPVPLSPGLRLRMAAEGTRKLDPDDLVALLSQQVSAEMTRVNQLSDHTDALTAMFFTKHDASPSALLAIIEQLSRIRIRQQAELRRSLGLLHHMVAPSLPTVRLQQVQVNAQQAAVNLGGKRKRSC